MLAPDGLPTILKRWHVILPRPLHYAEIELLLCPRELWVGVSRRRYPAAIELYASAIPGLHLRLYLQWHQLKLSDSPTVGGFLKLISDIRLFAESTGTKSPIW